jgi:uncharacterized membrane protein YqjE
MARDSTDFTEDLPDPGWRERLGAIKRSADALLSTRAAIFREELAEKGSLFGQAAAGLALGLAFASLALVLLTALIAAVLSRLLGGPIAGLAASLLLYLLIAAGAAAFGVKKLGRVRPFDFPVTRDELRKDFDAVREEGASNDEEPASPEALAAERASLRRTESGAEREERDDENRANEIDLEERFRAGSE